MSELVMAYADPPYIGQYHRYLIARLERDYPDGWALSLSSPTTGTILSICEDYGLSLADGDIRLMAWVKPFAAFKRNVRVAYAWEPVIVKPAERLEGAAPTRDFVEDLAMFDLDLAVAEPITMKRGLVGAKPEKFCFWLFEAMGLRPQDELHDLFPGSGAVQRAWERWSGREPEGDQLVFGGEAA